MQCNRLAKLCSGFYSYKHCSLQNQNCNAFKHDLGRSVLITDFGERRAICPTLTLLLEKATIIKFLHTSSFHSKFLNLKDFWCDLVISKMASSCATFFTVFVKNDKLFVEKLN